VMAGIAADVNAVYVPSLDQRVYAFRTDTGGEMWEQYLQGRLEDAPGLGGPVVLQRTMEGTLYALLRTTGEIQWKASDVSHMATIGQNVVWIADGAGNLKSLNLENGRETASAPAPGVKLFVRNTSDDNLILVTAGGLVGLYKPADDSK
jgi:outer membrane protein assembly factor BamB